ncbi:MAG: hypothetical protein PHV05_03740 [Candidatus Riflebacteria bacterium]|nr:hypothetical protein [Candidatus Riflebacteria bacterium]
MVKCVICGKEFERLAPHVKAVHGLCWRDYKQKYSVGLVEFINQRYITTRHKWLSYNDKGVFHQTNARGWSLNDSDIKNHLAGKDCIGVHVPQSASKFCGLDVDSGDFNDVLSILDAFGRLGIDRQNYLISVSGRKGWHVDLFFDELVSKALIQSFYTIILAETGLNSEQVELFGGNAKGYKLPFGVHCETGKKCVAVDEFGQLLPDDEIFHVKPMSVEALQDICDINNLSKADLALMLAGERLADSVNALPIYDAGLAVENIKRLIAEGVHEIGIRNKSLFRVAVYAHQYLKLKQFDCIDFLRTWIADKWSAAVVDAAIIKSVEYVVRSVYRRNYKLTRKIEISLADIREVMSVDSGHKLQTERLRRLYYALLIHSKIFAGAEGNPEDCFTMSYGQIRDAICYEGKKQDGKTINASLEKLAEMGKLQFVCKGERREKIGHDGKIFKSNVYRLPAFCDGITIEVANTAEMFELCDTPFQCADCLKVAACRLMPDRERSKFVKKQRFADLPQCKNLI